MMAATKKKTAGAATPNGQAKSISASIVAEPIDIVNMSPLQIVAAAIERLKKEDAEAAESAADDRQVFKAYFTAAFDTFHRMLDFAKQSADKPFFKGKINNLITTLATANENM